MPVDSKADAGSIRSAIRWGLFLAAVATFGFRLPRLVNEFRAWRGALRLGDASASESWRTFLIADGLGILIVLALGWVIFFVLRPRSQSQG
ncbi:MAG TPA: hypothetical protein VJO16_08950 [Candidatus Acidoferrum sp.]|nr:hypothetical protein [Candidatus Acidoferrum sp.]